MDCRIAHHDEYTLRRCALRQSPWLHNHAGSALCVPPESDMTFPCSLSG